MDESPGLIDSLADMESAFPQLTETLEAISDQIKATGDVATQGAADIDQADARGKGFAGRLAIARRVSSDLSEPAEAIWADGNTFASLIHTIDQGMRLLIERIPAEVEDNPDDIPEACEFFKTVRDLAEATQEGLSSIESMIETMAPLESMSRDMRPPLKRMRQGLTVMLEAREVADEWVRLVDAAGLDCEEAPMPVFRLTLQRTYHKMGFFNVGIKHDRYVRSTEGPVRIRLGQDGPEIEGRVDRHANQNGTARVMGGAQLKRWFQANFTPMDTVEVDLSSQDVIVMHSPAN
jgi:hypothetical protein